MLEICCNNCFTCVVKCMVVISLDSPSCGVCLFDPRSGGCIGTLSNIPRIVPFEVRLSQCCLYGDGQRTWAGIIHKVLPHPLPSYLFSFGVSSWVVLDLVEALPFLGFDIPGILPGWRRYIRVSPSRVVISRLGTYSAKTTLHDR